MALTWCGCTDALAGGLGATPGLGNATGSTTSATRSRVRLSARNLLPSVTHAKRDASHRMTRTGVTTRSSSTASTSSMAKRCVRLWYRRGGCCCAHEHGVWECSGRQYREGSPLEQLPAQEWEVRGERAEQRLGQVSVRAALLLAVAPAHAHTRTPAHPHVIKPACAATYGFWLGRSMRTLPCVCQLASVRGQRILRCPASPRSRGLCQSHSEQSHTAHIPHPTHCALLFCMDVADWLVMLTASCCARHRTPICQSWQGLFVHHEIDGRRRLRGSASNTTLDLEEHWGAHVEAWTNPDVMAQQAALHMSELGHA